MYARVRVDLTTQFSHSQAPKAFHDHLNQNRLGGDPPPERERERSETQISPLMWPISWGPTTFKEQFTNSGYKGRNTLKKT